MRNRFAVFPDPGLIMEVKDDRMTGTILKEMKERLFLCTNRKKNSWVVEVSRANKSSCDNHILHLVSGQNAWFQPSDSHLSSPWHGAFFVYYTLDAFFVNGNSWYNHLCTSNINYSFLPAFPWTGLNEPSSLDHLWKEITGLQNVHVSG